MAEVPPLEQYEAWMAQRRFRRCDELSARALRHIALGRRETHSFAAIAEGLGIAGSSAMSAYRRLPDYLK